MPVNYHSNRESGSAKRWLLIALATLGAIVLAINFALTPWVRKELDKWAAQQGFDSVKLESLRVQPLLGKGSLQGLSLTKDGETLLEVGNAEVSAALPDLLLHGALRIKFLGLTKAQVAVTSDGEQLSIAGIPLGKGGSGRRDGNNFVLDGLHISDSEMRFQGPVVSTSFHVNEVRIAGNDIEVDTVSMRDLNVRLQRTDVSTWDISTAKGAPGDRAGGSGGATLAALLPPQWSLQINKMQTTGASSVQYQDTILGQNLDYQLRIQKAVVTKIDSRRPDQATEFVLDATGTGEQAMHIQGRAYPFKTPFELDLHSKSEAKALPLLAAIARSQWGLEVHSQSASAELNMKLKGDQAQGEITVSLAGTEAKTGERTMLKLKKGLVTLPINGLLRGEPSIRLARFEGAKLHIAATADHQLTIAGLAVGTPSQSTTPVSDDKTPKKYAVDVLELVDSEIEYDGPTLDVTAHVNKATATPEGVRVDTLSLRDLRIGILHDESRKWRVVGESSAWKTGAENQAAKAGTPPGAKLPLPPISIARIEVVGDSAINYEELNEQGAYRRFMDVKEGYVTGLDTGKPEQPLRFRVRGTTNRFEKLSFTGEVRPFSKNSDWKISGEVLGWELPSLSRFSAPQLGFEVRTGQADGKFDIQVEKQQINGRFDLKLNLLDTITTDRKKLRRFEKKLPVRLGTAIAVLTNKYGAIPISIPVSGDSSRPDLKLDIDIDGAIKKAISGAVELGLFVAAPGLTALLQELKRKRLRLPPVEFQPLDTDLDERARELLASMAQTMHDRPRTMAPVCGKATDRDLQARLDLDTDVLDIAAQRAWNVKKYLVQQENIEAHRLIACQPELIREERGTTMDDVFEEQALTTPRVEFE